MACFGAYFAHAQICNVTRATKWFSSSFPNYKVPIQYCPSTTPVQLRTTKYYSVIQSTTPVLLCTTQYYSNTTPYQKVLLQRPAGRWTQYWPAGRDTWKRPAGRRQTAGRPAGDEIANKSPVLSFCLTNFKKQHAKNRTTSRMKRSNHAVVFSTDTKKTRGFCWWCQPHLAGSTKSKWIWIKLRSSRPMLQSVSWNVIICGWNRPQPRSPQIVVVVAGSQIRLTSWGKGSWNPIIYKVLYIPVVGRISSINSFKDSLFSSLKLGKWSNLTSIFSEMGCSTTN